MRILMVTPNLHFPFGGPPVTISQMAYALQSSGHNVEIAYGSPFGGQEKEDPRLKSLMEMGVTIRAFPLPGRSTSMIKWGISLPLIRFVRRSIDKYDLITIHQVWGLAFLLQLSPRIRSKSIQIPHESLTRFDVYKTSNLVTYFLKRIQLVIERGKRRVVLFSSELERRTSVGLSGSTQTAVAYHPLGKTELTVTRLEKPALASNTLKVGYIGRLHSKKNVAALISALAHVPEVELLIAGSGDLEEELKQHALSIGVSSRVRWLGFVTGEAKEAFYQSIHLSAVPSTYECFGQSAAEAMTRGIPLMCTSEVGAAEQLDESSCIRCGIDSVSIAAALKRFRDLHGETRKQIAGRAKTFALVAFSNKQFVDTVVTLIKRSEG